MEWGPRALGNRSILANAGLQKMQVELNLKIKFRESFRPFAPVVMEEHAREYFEGIESSPYMLFTYPVAGEKRVGGGVEREEEIGMGGGEEVINSRLQRPRSQVPAVTHIDYSARVQTVNERQNPRLYRLLKSFYIQSHIPLLINTSFNIRGEPIVCTPGQALECFAKTNMDALVMDRYLVYKGSYKRSFKRSKT